MKKGFLTFLLGMVYIGIIVMLMLSHVQMITGETERIMATVETLLLAVFAIILLSLYMKITQKEPLKPEIAETKKSQVSAITTYEQFVGNLREYDLSEREAEVAWLLYKGYTNRQIAEELFTAESTVKKHVSHIYEKMQVSGRKEFKEKLKT
ncbi:MAG: hypothetical protein IJN92_09920 [Lachnospiraceae bacterium]|nr:hypothetical protein [Lachnospiraceae bacterium]